MLSYSPAGTKKGLVSSRAIPKFRAAIMRLMPLFAFFFSTPGHTASTTYVLESAYQRGPQEIRVLVPDSYREDRRYPVLYVLPVEAGFNDRFGYGLGVLEELDAHNAYDIIIVEPGFEIEPWFGDHASDDRTRQAAYITQFLVPFIEDRYSTPGTLEGRLLFGFSKSGWGAFSLILGFPEFFGFAASWDAPLLFREFHYGMKDVYGTEERLRFFRPDLLIRRNGKYFRERVRLVLCGERDWGTSIPAPGGGSHTKETHTLLESEGILHYYDGAMNAPHRWDRSWVGPLLNALMEIYRKQ